MVPRCGRTKDIALIETIGGDDCRLTTSVLLARTTADLLGEEIFTRDSKVGLTEREDFVSN